MNIYISTELSQHQEAIIRDIAHNQIKTLLVISSEPSMMHSFEPTEKRRTLSKLLKDFSKVCQKPHQIFNTHPDTKSIFKHQLFQVTMDKRQSNATYQLAEISSLWRKVGIDDTFTPLFLQ